ncbi:MAG: ABC transporter permease [Erysipelotrichaceae bacterium]|nr:ABC transporter permease [Erysipelotrichaceae bacterium]MBQ9987826.1 ABC transporter permease [Erysipelotrichales bacterium]MBR3693362.1 ABC transporter permease [Erysipelotrichales bacterium]
MTTNSNKVAKSTFKWTEERPFEALRILSSILIALVITFAVLCFVSPDPVNDFISLLIYPTKSSFNFGYVFVKMVPLCFAGLATLLYFRTGLFNLSTEGIFYISGVACTYIAINTNILTGNSIIDSAMTILFAAIVGGLIALIPGYLKGKLNADEMVISLMMNNILYGIGFYIVKTYLAVPGITGTSSAPFETSAKLSNIIPKTQVHSGILIMLAMVILVYIVLFKTKLGYSIRMTGLNKSFAKYSGMSAFSLFMAVHFMAGFLGGMGSAVELMGVYRAFTWSTTPGLGFAGALMAMLGKNHPIGVMVAAFGISYLRASAQLLANSSPVIDVKLVSIVEVILTLLISSQYFLRKWREKQLLKEEQKNG